MKKIFEVFSLNCKKALKYAHAFALKSKSPSVEMEHILLAISKQKGSIGSEILHQLKIQPETIEKFIGALSSQEHSREIMLSLSAQKAIKRAALVSSLNEHQYVGTEHMLFGIFDLNDEKINNLLKSHDVGVKDIKNKIKMVFKSTSKFPQISNTLNSLPQRADDIEIERFTSAPSKKSMLEFFATNLTDKKIQKNIDPVIGRENEIERIIQILSRRTKNNPLLLGDPGVGKTAIIEGLAKKILSGDVPEVLMNKKIYTLDLGMLIAGSSFRGEFEHRLKQIILEVKNDPDIILFVDEIHNIVGAGAAAGSMDAANILKPSLARGEVRCIGATTLEEYKKHIENDMAFERRFQTVMVHEPSMQKTIEILMGTKIHFERFHKVSITDDAIRAAVELSGRYFQEKFFPDKAIDLIDETASSFKIKIKPDEAFGEIRELEKEYSKISDQKKKAVIFEDYDLALNLRHKEEEILKTMSRLKLRHSHVGSKTLGAISDTDIKETVSKITNIPVQDLTAHEKKQILSLEEKIKENIVGQDVAIKTIVEYIRRAWVGIHDAERPIGSFIFLGPSGVGKTELAKTLAQAVFHDSRALIRIDMSEFAEGFNISKLIGSPAGYVGYKDPTNLTDRVKRKPYSVVLFDEIEKAHPQVFNLILQVLEDGRLTDASGKTANFKNTIIIMTSNIGSDLFNKKAKIGFDARHRHDIQYTVGEFEETKKQVLEKLSKFFRVEFLNRIDKVVVFEPLNKLAIEKIVRIEIAKLEKKLKEKNINLRSDTRAIEHIAKLSYAPALGARAVRKNVLEHIENPIAEKILSENLDSSSRELAILYKNKKIIIQ